MTRLKTTHRTRAADPASTSPVARPAPMPTHPGRGGARRGKPGALGPALLGPALLGMSLLGMALPAAPAFGQSTADLLGPRLPGERLTACLETAARAPTRALEEAQAWETAGGGNAARLCAAEALDQRGDHAAAAARFGSLGDELATLEDPAASVLLERAGRAWLLAGRPEMARGPLDRAVRLAPHDPYIRVASAYAAVAAGDHGRAIRALDDALETHPDPAVVLHLRAAAHRQSGALEPALADIDRALAARPDDPDFLLEQGNILRLLGRDEEAAASWHKVTAVAPGTAAAEDARINLQRLGR